MCVLLITRLLRGVGRWARKPVNHTSWVAVVTPTDRPKSVRNCCLIELFCGVVCVATLPLWYFCWYRGFCHRTGSDLLLFVFWPLGSLNCWSFIILSSKLAVYSSKKNMQTSWNLSFLYFFLIKLGMQYKTQQNAITPWPKQVSRWHVSSIGKYKYRYTVFHIFGTFC